MLLHKETGIKENFPQVGEQYRSPLQQLLKSQAQSDMPYADVSAVPRTRTHTTHICISIYVTHFEGRFLCRWGKFIFNCLPLKWYIKQEDNLFQSEKFIGLIYRLYLFIRQVFARPGDGLRWIWPNDSGSVLLLVPVLIIKRDFITSWNLVMQKYISYAEVINSRVSTEPHCLQGWSWVAAAPNLIFPGLNQCFILLLFGFIRQAGKEQRTWWADSCLWHRPGAWPQVCHFAFPCTALPSWNMRITGLSSFVWVLSNFSMKKTDIEDWGVSSPFRIKWGRDSMMDKSAAKPQSRGRRMDQSQTVWDDALASWES